MNKTARDFFSLLLTLAVLIFAPGCAYVAQVSLTPTAGVEPDGDSADPSMSEDGRYVAFASEATNLLTNDTNSYKDIFVRDNEAGVTELISRTPSGFSGNNLSGQPDISGDGRYVVFWSYADDLITADTNGKADVFLFDRRDLVMERVSLDSAGNQVDGFSLGGSVTDDGRYVVFYTDAAIAANDLNNSFDVYKRDRQSGTTTLVSENLSGNAAGSSFDPAIGRDGQSVVFWSSASDLTGGDTNGFSDVFLEMAIFPCCPFLINLSDGGNGHSYTGDVGFGQAPSVVFRSTASNLVAGDNDTNGVSDIFLSTWNGVTFVTERITDGDGASTDPVLGAADPGENITVAYGSIASNLQEPGAQPADTNGFRDIYLWEKNQFTSTNGRTWLMSQTFDGNLTDGHSFGRPAISADGKAVAYSTDANNVPPQGSNSVEDIYARTAWMPEITGVSGPLTAGQTVQITLFGEFVLRPGIAVTSATVLGNGVVSVTVDEVGYFDMKVSVEMAPDAVPGQRDLIVYRPHPELGIDAPFGVADSIQITVN